MSKWTLMIAAAVLALPGAVAHAAGAAPAAVPAGVVAVVGADGRTGRLIVGQLLAAHWKVRALVRDPTQAAAAVPAGAELLAADVRDPKSLAAALAGASYLISAVGASGFHPVAGNSPQDVDFQGVRNLAYAAREAHLKQLVLVSSTMTSHADTAPEFMRGVLGAKFQGEQALRASGVPYTIVKPGGLLDEAGGKSVAMTQGDQASGRIPRADVAAVCVAALGRKSALSKTFEVVSGEAVPVGDWDARFAALAADAPPGPDAADHPAR